MQATESLESSDRAVNTAGAVQSMLVDIDEIVPVTVADGRTVRFTEQSGANDGVVDEIADRVIRSGGEVLAVCKPDIPKGKSLAAILRYPP